MSPNDFCTLLYLAAWVILSWSLQLVESSHAKQIQRFLPWGHGSVICQTKCFLRLAICTHQVSVTCKSRFTKCQKAFHCNLRGGGANKTQWHYITVHFSHLAETLNLQRTVPWNVQSHTSETTRIVWFHRNVTTEATNTFFAFSWWSYMIQKCQRGNVWKKFDSQRLFKLREPLVKRKLLQRNLTGN